MYVKVMSHLLNPRGAYAVLFSPNGNEFRTVDGLCEKDLIGFEEISCKSYPTGSPIPLRLFGKSLAEKITLLKLHVKYKDEKKYLRHFYGVATKLVNMQMKTEEDLQLPEIVISLANLPANVFLGK